MKKPRIIILMHYMELGGAEMALIGLLNALDPKKVSVDLFIYSHRGPLMQYIPQWVNLLPEIGAYSVIEEPMIVAFKRGYVGVVARRLLAKYKFNQFRKKSPAHGDDSAIMQYVGDYVTPCLPNVKPDIEYDLCISFLTPHNIGRNKIRAKKRLAWIHTDYSTIDVETKRELPVWDAYNNIASISDQVTESFLKRFPSLKSKIIHIENILSTDYIKKRSEEFDVAKEMNGDVKLLSIGRYCTAKNYDNVPDIARRIVEAGIRELKWFIIGYGSDEALIRSKIAEAGMENHVFLLGKRDNPYPYIKACDIYVQPSRYEGKSITVREAQILGKPVVVTNYPTSSSQINNNIDGIIVSMDNFGCAYGIAQLIMDVEKQKSLSNYCLTHEFGHTKEVEKIYGLIKE